VKNVPAVLLLDMAEDDDLEARSELVQRLRVRDGPTGGAVGAYLQKPVLGWIICQLGQPSDQVDDIFQHCFVEIFKSLHTYAGRAKLQTWALAIVSRQVGHWVTTQAVERAQRVVAHDEEVSDPSAEDEPRVESPVRAALALLSEREAKIIWLLYFEQFSRKEAAEALGLSSGRFGRAVCEARLRFKEALGKVMRESQ
jgi:RNA polymerase sigma factor (sigma-70 family)